MTLLEGLQRAVGELQRTADPGELPRRLDVIARAWGEVTGRQWEAASIGAREAAVALIKEAVVDGLIPVAGLATMAGLPGIVAYTPCQVAGALAVARVYTGEFPLRAEHVKTAMALVLWGKLGQLLFTNAAELLKPLLTPPLVGLAVMPFVQAWTRAALDHVDAVYAQRAADGGQGPKDPSR